MTIAITEAFGSRETNSAEQSSATRKYYLFGDDDVDNMLVALKTAAPSTSSGIARTDVKVGPQLAPLLWEGVAQYGDQERIAGDSQHNFEIAMESEHITRGIVNPLDMDPMALGANKYTPVSDGTPAVSAPNLGGGINFDGEKMNGVDIQVPKYSFSETITKASTFVDASYKAALAALAGKVNDASFKGFAAGEVLYVGCQGTQKCTGGDWELTHRFVVSKNKNDIQVGKLGRTLDKLGWEYLWVLYKSITSEGIMVQEPAAAYVMQVYDLGSFSGIGIGT